MVTEVLMAHKEFTGTFSGNGWRATLKAWPQSLSPGVLSISIHDPNWNYLYTAGAFIWDGAWIQESPAGQLKQNREPVYFRVLEASNVIGEGILPVEEESVTLLVEPEFQPTPYETLSVELSEDPKELGYAAMTDQEAADELNKVQFSTLLGFSVTRSNQYLVVNEKMQAIEDSAEKAAKDWLLITKYFPSDQFTGIGGGGNARVTDPAALNFVATTLDGLVTAGLITESDKDNMTAYSETGQSRRQEINVNFVVRDGDVGFARNL